MKRTTTLAACALAATVATATLPSTAQDIVKVAPQATRVLLDNDEVRVLEVMIAPGAKTGMHSHPRHVLYFVEAGNARQTMPDGTAKEMSRKAGEAAWSDAVTHDTQNLGSTKTKVLLVELKK